MAEHTEKMNWIEPEIRELEVQETNAFRGVGNDTGGSPFPDCQRS